VCVCVCFGGGGGARTGHGRAASAEAKWRERSVLAHVMRTHAICIETHVGLNTRGLDTRGVARTWVWAHMGLNTRGVARNAGCWRGDRMVDGGPGRGV
jgi:hypothetical protein